ncbi:MAG: hypothetical protein AAB840_03120 [Patescibacteria group bacterium]
MGRIDGQFNTKGLQKQEILQLFTPEYFNLKPETIRVRLNVIARFSKTEKELREQIKELGYLDEPLIKVKQDGGFNVSIKDSKGNVIITRIPVNKLWWTLGDSNS